MMEQQNIIQSNINDDVSYYFEDLLLDKDDDTIESDIHEITIFGKPYLIAMGKMRRHQSDDGLVYFVSYLVYEDKVVCKLGIYESKIGDEQDELNHREFDFGNEKLMLFDKYYEDTALLEPYKYTRSHIPIKKSIILGDNIEFEENNEQQRKYISELQTRFKTLSDNETENLKEVRFFYKILKSIYTNITDKVIKNQLKIKISPTGDEFGFTKIKNTLQVASSKLFERFSQDNLVLTDYELIVIEYLANVKIIIVHDKTLTFNVYGDYKDGTIPTSFMKIERFANFNPNKVVFVTPDDNKTNKKEYSILTYGDKWLVDFKELSNDLIKVISQKKDVNEQENANTLRFNYLRSIISQKQQLDTKSNNDAIETVPDPDALQESGDIPVSDVIQYPDALREPGDNPVPDIIQDPDALKEQVTIPDQDENKEELEELPIGKNVSIGEKMRRLKEIRNKKIKMNKLPPPTLK